jgi:hypothetical protein
VGGFLTRRAAVLECVYWLTKGRIELLLHRLIARGMTLYPTDYLARQVHREWLGRIHPEAFSWIDIRQHVVTFAGRIACEIGGA